MLARWNNFGATPANARPALDQRSINTLTARNNTGRSAKK
jgi:hypothetical protein